MRGLLLAVMVGLVCPGVVRADVRADEKTQIKFEGALGRVLNLFGGRATRDGVTTTVAVKGDRKMTVSGNTGQIIDLAEEKVYDIDLRDKSYTVTTFAELRQQMEEARRKAAEQAKNDPDATAGREPGEAAKEVEVDFNLAESGQRRAINGFDAREVVMTVAVREKGKTLEQSGGLVLTSNTWLAPKIAGMNEVAEFDAKYARKLSSPAMLDAQQMAAVLAMYPMMQQAMARFEAENVNMDGTPVLTTVKFETVANPAQAAQAAETKSEPSRPTSIGGLAGGLGGRLGRRVLGGDKNEAAATPGRATVLTMQHETLKVTPSASDADVALPAGFKLRAK